MEHRHNTQIGEVAAQEVLASYSRDGCQGSKTPPCSTSGLIIIETVIKISKIFSCLSCELG